jgi:hypothetical protein
MTKTAPIRFRVSVEQKAAIERIAAERGVPLAALFRDPSRPRPAFPTLYVVTASAARAAEDLTTRRRCPTP